MEPVVTLTHQELGVKQELFMFSEVSPGSCFLLPRGARIYNKLIDFLRREYLIRGYDEVITPNIANTKLWIPSGHWDKYKENMFCFQCDDLDYSLTPMNCPKHALIYKSKIHSYRELPIRLADFGVLHRNELHGALTGLTRVRRFCQDDAHIFCRIDQIESEIKSVLEFIRDVYLIFGFPMTIGLSTRPEKYIGSLDVWNLAEATLKQTLESLKLPYVLKEGDGAFYGPKIDIHIEDALNRKHQCATVQLDFNLPERFELEYVTSVQDKPERPVMIHRAILGSVERFFAILCEHTQGKWPFWISPRQVSVIPIKPQHQNFAENLRKELAKNGFYCDVDISDETMDKRVVRAKNDQYNYIIVIGNREVTNNSLAVRKRDSNEAVNISVSEFLDQCRNLSENKK